MEQDPLLAYLGPTIEKHPPLPYDEEKIICQQLEEAKFPFVIFMWVIGVSKLDPSYAPYIKNLGGDLLASHEPVIDGKQKAPELEHFLTVAKNLRHLLNTVAKPNYAKASLVVMAEARSSLPDTIFDTFTPLAIELVLNNIQPSSKRYGDLRTKFILHNLKLVLKLGNKYRFRGLPAADIFQEGYLGLQRAVDKYCLFRGFRFSTYATWWIKQAICRSIAEKGRQIRIPIHMQEKIQAIRDQRDKYLVKFKKLPTDKELSEFSGFPEKAVRLALSCEYDVSSLHELLTGDSDTSILDTIKDDDALEPSEGAHISLIKENMEQLLGDLTDRERLVLEYRFGLKTGKAFTLEQVGKVLEVTRERVRQIQDAALRKLRRPRKLGQVHGDPSLVLKRMTKKSKGPKVKKKV